MPVRGRPSKLGDRLLLQTNGTNLEPNNHGIRAGESHELLQRLDLIVPSPLMQDMSDGDDIDRPSKFLLSWTGIKDVGFDILGREPITIPKRLESQIPVVNDVDSVESV